MDLPIRCSRCARELRAYKDIEGIRIVPHKCYPNVRSAVIITGNVLEGFTFYGPFESLEIAEEVSDSIKDIGGNELVATELEPYEYKDTYK